MRHTDSLKRHGRVTIAFDLFIIVLSGVAALVLRWGGFSALEQATRTHWLIISVPFVWFIALSWQNAWVFTGYVSESESYRRVIRAGIMAFLTISTISFAFKGEFSRGFVFLSTLIATAALLLQRRYSWKHFKKTMKRRGLKERGLVITNEDERYFLEQISIDFPHSELQLFELDREMARMLADLEKAIKDYRIDFVVCASFRGSSGDWIPEITRVADNLDCQFYLVDPLRSVSLRRNPQQHGLNYYSRLAEPRLWHSKALFKRGVDIVISALALVLLAPIWLIIALMIKLTSRGPVLFTDKRIGFKGERFTFPKFRSMYVGADKDRSKVLGVADDGIGERYKRDPRITPLGRILRRVSLDETPQFWCVLIGTMSLVGPRPILAEEIPQMKESDTYRHIARPGLTGLWQVSGRKEISWEQRMEMDLQYVHNWSPSMDLVLILKTLNAIMTGKGAY